MRHSHDLELERVVARIMKHIAVDRLLELVRGLVSFTSPRGGEAPLA